jgi:hypothetical protein
VKDTGRKRNNKMTEKLDWVDNAEGTHIGVRVTREDGTSEKYGLKAAGFFGRFGESMRKRLSIDRHNPTRKWDIKADKKIIWRS